MNGWQRLWICLLLTSFGLAAFSAWQSSQIAYDEMHNGVLADADNPACAPFLTEHITLKSGPQPEKWDSGPCSNLWLYRVDLREGAEAADFFEKKASDTKPKTEAPKRVMSPFSREDFLSGESARRRALFVDHLKNNLSYGLGIPFAVLIVAFAFVWVRSGFRKGKSI